MIAAMVFLVRIPVHWGLNMGMSSFATMQGDALHVFGGAVTLLFSAVSAWVVARAPMSWARECSWLLLACLIATTSLNWGLAAVGLMDIERV